MKAEADELIANARTEADDTVAKAKAEADEILADARAEAQNTLARSRAEAAEHLQRSQEELAKLQEEAETRMREIQADTEAIWEERRELLEDIRGMASGLVDSADAADARFLSRDPAGPEEEMQQPQAGDETDPPGVATDEPTRPMPAVRSHEDEDGAPREEVTERTASGQDMQRARSPTALWSFKNSVRLEISSLARPILVLTLHTRFRCSVGACRQLTRPPELGRLAVVRAA